MKYELNMYHRNTPDQELLDDLKKVADQIGMNEFTREQYNQKGNFASTTFEKRFGTWNKALEKAGLKITRKQNLSEKELFENIEEAWVKLGRQPLYEEMKKPLSKYSQMPYRKIFGGWRKALEAFIEYINSNNEEVQETEENEQDENNSDTVEIAIKHKTKRNISERLKVQVLMRDGNKCKLCGITVTGEDIHFDHIKPWSKGGKTVLENLQVLCATHNLAKGNLEYNEK
ncbi:MAG: HNH endonuclease [Deltaproteobacteria bacterium]|nr:HNH endonuclease [Deltaproteobacteria bacterium]